MIRIHTRPHQWRVIAVFQLLVGLLFTTSALGQPAFLKDGLVAYYPFNGNANDESGNGNQGYLKNDAAILNGKLILNGVNGMVEIPNFIRLNGSATISIRAFAQSLESRYVEFVSQGAPLNGFYIGIDPLKRIRIGMPSGQNFYSQNYQFPVSKWVSIDVVFEYKSGKITLLIDGKFNSEFSHPVSFGNFTGSPCRIGAQYQNYGEFFHGFISYVRFYNRDLSSFEIGELYKYESELVNNDSITEGLIAYYPFNGNVNDESGNSNNGSLKNGALIVDGAARFSSMPAKILVASAKNLPVGMEARTVSFWINPTTEHSTSPNIFGGFIVSWGNCGYMSTLEDNTAPPKLVYAAWHGMNDAAIKEELLNKNQYLRWRHIAVVKPAGSKLFNFYLDGKFLASSQTPANPIVSYNRLEICGSTHPTSTADGSGFGEWGDGYTGDVDNIRIYNRALSDAEVKALYDYESTPPNIVPVFANQPQTQSTIAGNDATFCVTLKDSGSYNYQWQRNEQNIAGATLNCYTINSVTAAMDGSRYRVIVSNSAGTIISDSATLTVVTPPPPTIATQPTPKTVQEGANVSLSVVATGQGTLVYQWQFNEQNLPGATSSTLNLNAVKLNTAGRYRVLVSSQYGVTISDTVTLTVNPNPPPTIVTQPISRTPAEGTQVSLTVTATGIGTITYQWQVNGQNIPGATSSTLVLSAVRPSVNGNYRVIVGNPYGTTISTEATVTVVVTDSDSDGLSDYEELLFGTNSNKSDSDGDGLSDFAEVRTHGSNPLTTDTDGDGYSDGIEVARDGNPNNRSVTPTGALAVFPAVDVEFYTLNGVKYQLEVSTDMASWSAQGGVVVGTGGNQNHLVRASKATQFWRLKVVQ